MISYHPLWNTMEKKGITTYYLRNKCGDDNISSSTIRRLQSGLSVSTNTLDSLCKILKCRLSEIVEYVD